MKLGDFTRKANRFEMCMQAIRMGFEADKDIQQYLESCGVPINIKTFASYKSQYRNGALFKNQSKPKRGFPNISQIAEGLTPAALTLKICRLAKMVGV